MIYIYTLIDPRTKAIRYVGKTNKPKVRLKTHYTRKFTTSCSTWVWGLRAQGLKPIIDVIDEVPDSMDWKTQEQYWIDRLRSDGHELLNSAPAGAGPPVGWTHSEETREKLRQRFKGRPIPPEQRAKISKSLTGRTQSPETIAKREATIRARRPPGWKIKTPHDLKVEKRIRDGKPEKFSPEWRAKIAASLKARYVSLSPEEQEAMKQRGREGAKRPRAKRWKLSDETRAKLSAIHKARLAGLSDVERKQRMQAAIEARRKSA